MIKLLLASVIAIALVYYLLFNNKKMRTYNHYWKRKKILEDAIKEFVSSEKYINQNMALAVNRDDRKLCICVMKKGMPVISVTPFEEIKGCEILEDGTPVNAINPAAGEKLNRIDLKIIINDSENQSILANFLFWEVTRDSEEYKLLSHDANYWYDIINNIIKG